MAQAGATVLKVSQFCQRLSPCWKLWSIPVRTICFRSAYLQPVSFDRAHIFMREVDPRDAFVVGGERDGNVVFAVDRERMIFAADAEDEIVAGESDFDHDVIFRHRVHQLVRIFFVHDVHAVADAFGVAEFDGPANMAAEAFVRDEAGSEFSGVHRDMNFGVDECR